jgi:hypothetical protein
MVFLYPSIRASTSWKELCLVKTTSFAFTASQYLSAVKNTFIKYHEISNPSQFLGQHKLPAVKAGTFFSQKYTRFILIRGSNITI